MSEVKERARAYLKPKPRDEKFEQMDKKSMQYRSQEWRRMCILCLNAATQMLCYQMDGCEFLHSSQINKF